MPLARLYIGIRQGYLQRHGTPRTRQSPYTNGLGLDLGLGLGLDLGLGLGLDLGLGLGLGLCLGLGLASVLELRG